MHQTKGKDQLDDILTKQGPTLCYSQEIHVQDKDTKKVKGGKSKSNQASETTQWRPCCHMPT